ncbi:hypothetical protein ABVK25_005986 [Lepraria finkii]|uniref:Acyltransferase 3 domain-containing protein n=1 Tax=Lepraria finkii TaxID=1340010 RepID=A0ABR4B742_9LECA
MSVTVGYLQAYAEKTKWKPTLGSKEFAKKALLETSWADGLRGIAAVYVMFSHLTMAFARYIVRPADGEMGPQQWRQTPILRLVGQGQAWVACFIILSGFVNSLKAIKLVRQGNVEAALSNLAVSSFRRSFRLFLPATAATIISWFICQFGAYETARQSDAYWLYITSPQPSYSWGTAIEDLIRAARNTWLFNPDNVYDQPQWALLYLLEGSMVCFTALLATANLTTRWRLLTFTGCWFWSWNWGIRIGDPMVCPDIFLGIMLAELNHSEIPLALSQFSPLFAPPMVIASLVLMSFPSEFHTWAPWCKFLLEWFYKLSPTNAELSRFWPTIGAQLLILTCVLSPHLRRALSHKYLLWLGKISFPLYLLHGSFMRSLLSWMLFARSKLVEMEERNGDQTYIVMRYPLPGYTTFFIAMPIFFGALFAAAHYWANKVEPHFGVITRSAEDLMFKKRERPAVLPVRQERPD